MLILIAGKITQDTALLAWVRNLPGTTCYLARTSPEAVDLLTHHPDIALAIIDADLPETGAFPLILFCRQKRPVSFHIILVSTFSMPVLYLALKTGCTEMLSKPYSHEIIRDIITHYDSEIKP